MSLSLFIARRIYRESDGGKQVSRPAVLIAMAGIAIGLAVMIIAVAVVIGFKSEVRNKVIGFGSHIQITNLDAVSSYETHPIVVGDSMMTALDGYPEISHVQRFSTKPGMIKTDDAFQGMVLKGVGPEFDPRFLQEYLVEGEIPVFSDSVSSNRVLISKSLATKMKLKLGDKIYTYYIQDDVRARRLTIAGIYQTNFSEYDNLFLLTDLSLVNRLNGWQPEQVTGVELQLKDYDKLEDTTYEIAIDTDNRKDEYGGSLENRMRFMRMCMEEVMKAAGSDMAVTVKTNMRDGFKGGLEIDECLEVARTLQDQCGAHALVLSGGFVSRAPMYVMRGEMPIRTMAYYMPRGYLPIGIRMVGKYMIPSEPFKEAYFLEDALKFRKALHLPLIYVGGLVSRDNIEEVLNDGFEFVAMARALVNEPGFVNRMKEDEHARCDCGHSNYCIARMYSEDMVCHKNVKGLPECIVREIKRLEYK